MSATDGRGDHPDNSDWLGGAAVVATLTVSVLARASAPTAPAWGFSAARAASPGERHFCSSCSSPTDLFRGPGRRLLGIRSDRGCVAIASSIYPGTRSLHVLDGEAVVGLVGRDSIMRLGG